MNLHRFWSSLTRPRTPPHDEEGLLHAEEEWKPPIRPKWAKNRFGRLRMRKATVYLLLIDLLVIALLVHAFEPLITLLRRNEELFGTQIELDHNDAIKTSPPADQQKIPRILHQTCKNETVPEVWVSSQQSCIETYHDFEYMLWTDERARHFISEEYPWYLDTWDTYPFPIQRADAIRYLILYHYGGIYMDMDTVCNKTFPLHQIEEHKADHWALFKSTLPTGITNDFMVSSARHPAFKSVIQRLVMSQHRTSWLAGILPYAVIMISTGPMFLTLGVKNYLLDQPSLPSPNVLIINPDDLDPYIADLQTASWHQEDAAIALWLGDKPWTWFEFSLNFGQLLSKRYDLRADWLPAMP
ncbi:putative glycosyltransferase C4F11.04c [Fusarium austroafricanum]|uniref:Putative glycosyltransferase C4F11.04c n=1 Tax=Fusarium austroafricanum TaxID=2364996 RepID=A0A8H4NXP8_9HYPO|nr:putative glycosyltransferase C4F11.04c [Fusarium austroafricanum]